MSKQDSIISLLKEINKTVYNSDIETAVDLVVTENNKEYSPNDYNADAFRSVKTEIPKVKVTSFTINDNCIDENGYWGAEFLDVENVTNISNSLRSTLMTKADFSSWRMPNLINANSAFMKTAVENIDLSNAGMEKLTDGRGMFYSIYVKEINVSNWKKPKSIYGDSLFYKATSLEKIIGFDTWIDIKVNPDEMFLYCHKLVLNCKLPFDVSEATSCNGTFRLCHANEWLDLTTWDMSNVNTTGIGQTSMFVLNYKLYSIIGENPNIEDVVTYDIKVLKNLKVTFDLSYGNNALERPSLRALINGLADLTGSDSQTLILGPTLIAKLTEEDIAIATAKNWTIA